MIKLEKLEKGEFFKDAFLISYRYNKDYLNKMRSLKYKRYVPDKKAWEIPSSELKHLVDLFGVDDINVNAKYLEGLVEKEESKTEEAPEDIKERLKDMVYNGIWDKCLPKSAAIWRNFLTSVICAGIFTVIYGTCLFRMGATETQITRLALGFLIGITIVSFIILRTLAFINRKRNQNSPNVQERKETSQSKTEWTKIYNAQNIVETEQLVEMLKQSGIEAFSQEAGANVAMHGAPGFGIYGVDIFVKTDDAKKAVQLIKEINNQENEEIF